MRIFKTGHFEKLYKKLHSNQQDALDIAIGEIISNPLIGFIKKSDLQGLHVHKFKMQQQLVLIAYRYLEAEQRIHFIAFGPHENFYRDLKH